MERSEKVILSVDAQVVRQAQAAAAREGMSLADWVARSIRREALASEAAAIRAVEPRVGELIDRHKDLARATLRRALGRTG